MSKKLQTPAERLRETRVKLGFNSARGAAIEMGWHPTTYASHENGHRELTRDAAERYARGFEVDWLWLMYGADAGRVAKKLGLAEAPSKPLTKVNASIDVVNTMGPLPLFRADSAGDLQKWIAGHAHDPREHFKMVEETEDTFAFGVDGDDMVVKPPVLGERSFNPGDVAVVRAGAEIRAGDFVLCTDLKGKHLALRKWRPTADGGRLEALNHDYSEMNLGGKQAKVLGRVIRHVQKI